MMNDAGKNVFFLKIVHLLIGTLKIVSDSNEKSFVFPHIAIVTQGVVHIVRKHTKRGEGGRLSLVHISSVFAEGDVIYHAGVSKRRKIVCALKVWARD